MYHQLIDAAEYYSADEVNVVGRDDDGTLLFVAVYATDDEAAELLAFLERVRDESVPS